MSHANPKRGPNCVRSVFVIDPVQEAIAVNEARKLKIPIVAITDTNCDPYHVDFVIPGNDDAIRSCSLVVRVVADAIEAGKSKVTVEEMAPAPVEEAVEEEPAAAEEVPAEVRAE